MKILQSSNIYLGRSFLGTAFPGEKLRALIKTAFSKIIDTALQQSVDMVIFAGDTFANPEISQNLLDFFVSEIKRLEATPVVIMPGNSDGYEKESFWAQWRVIPPAKNLHILSDADDNVVKIEEKSVVVFGFPPSRINNIDDWAKYAKTEDDSSYHIAVIYGDFSSSAAAGRSKSPVSYELLKTAPFNYIAFGGRNGYAALNETGVKAAYSGSPVALGPGWNDAGNILVIELIDDSISINKIPISDIVWKEVQIPVETVANLDDLKGKIQELAGDNVLLKVTLSGLALLDTALNTHHLQKELEERFLDILVVDNTSVLPDNVSAIKVQEKTMLGQFLKVMIDKLKNSSGEDKRNYEEALKMGYTLLSGKEIR